MTMMDFKELGDIIANSAEIAAKFLEHIENNRKKSENYLRGDKWTKKQIKDMEKKEPKRDKDGRFAKKADKPKVEVKFEVERPEGMSTEEYIKQLEKERDAFKLTAERMSGKYLDECKKVKELERKAKELCPYYRHWNRLFDIAMTWKDRALAEQEKHLFAMDALRVASMHIWWLRSKLSWFKLWKNRKKLVEMDVEMDRMVARVEGLDRE